MVRWSADFGDGQVAVDRSVRALRKKTESKDASKVVEALVGRYLTSYKSFEPYVSSYVMLRSPQPHEETFTEIEEPFFGARQYADGFVGAQAVSGPRHGTEEDQKTVSGVSEMWLSSWVQCHFLFSLSFSILDWKCLEAFSAWAEVDTV